MYVCVCFFPNFIRMTFISDVTCNGAKVAKAEILEYENCGYFKTYAADAKVIRTGTSFFAIFQFKRTWVPNERYNIIL